MVIDDRRPQLVALGSLLVGVAIFTGKLIVGVLTGSLGIISEAAHSGLDVAASGFTVVAVRTARKPADVEHPYGHGRAENLAAYTEGVLLLLTAVGIAYEAVNRLLMGHTHVDAATYALVLLVAAMVIESGRAVVLRWAGRLVNSAALQADSQNRLADVLSSLGVLLGLVGVRAGYWWADSIAALLVALLIGYSATRILLEAGDELMDRSPAGAEDDLRATIGAVKGVREVRGVRVRRSGGRLIADARVSARRTLSVDGAQALTEDVQDAVTRAMPGMDLVLAVEGQLQSANLVERIHATANRFGQVRDLHNVTVEKEDDGTLHLTMHAKLPSHITLEEAAGITAELEARLKQELPEAARFDVHLEPLEPDVVSGHNVTKVRAELAARVRAVVMNHPEVVSCRDVELSSREGRITAHVVAAMAGGLTLEQAHLVESAIEIDVHNSVPELEEVVARATA
ncbi:MAG: cation diffusion facilitator family transporter [Candidatus Dormibacteraceae bacterium]